MFHWGQKVNLGLRHLLKSLYMFWIPSGLISMVSDDPNIVAASLKAKIVNSHKPAFQQEFFKMKARTNN